MQVESGRVRVIVVKGNMKQRKQGSKKLNNEKKNMRMKSSKRG